MKYDILITDTCLTLLEKISDKRIQRTILKRIEGPAEDPEKQGKELVRSLAGFRSVHVAGKYRAIYKIDGQTVIVYVLAVGIRKEGDKKDVYEIARKMLDAGLLELDKK